MLLRAQLLSHSEHRYLSSYFKKATGHHIVHIPGAGPYTGLFKTNLQCPPLTQPSGPRSAGPPPSAALTSSNGPLCPGRGIARSSKRRRRRRVLPIPSVPPRSQLSGTLRGAPAPPLAPAPSLAHAASVAALSPLPTPPPPRGPSCRCPRPFKAAGAAFTRRLWGLGEDGGGRCLGRVGPGAVVVCGCWRAGEEAAGRAGQEEGHSGLQRRGHGSAAGAVGGAERGRGYAEGTPRLWPARGVRETGAALTAPGKAGGLVPASRPPFPRAWLWPWCGAGGGILGLVALRWREADPFRWGCGLLCREVTTSGRTGTETASGELPWPRKPAACPAAPALSSTLCPCVPQPGLSVCCVGVLRVLLSKGWIAGEMLISGFRSRYIVG